MASKLSYRKELTRVKKMAARLEKKGYEITGDLSKLTVRQLKNIKSGTDLVKRKIYSFTEQSYEVIRRKQNMKRLRSLTKKAEASGYEVDRARFATMTNEELRNISSIRDLVRRGYAGKRYSRPKSPVERDGNVLPISDVSQVKYDSSGEHIPRNNVFRGSQATVDVDMLLSIAEYGKTYRSMKTEGSGEALVNKNGRYLVDLITKARMKHSDEEIVAAIEKGYGSVRLFAETIERLVLAVYDEIYAEWSMGKSAWDVDMKEVENTLLELKSVYDVDRM